MFTFITAFKSCVVIPYSAAIFVSAVTSLGKQEPPHPIPAFKNLSPILLS